MSPRDDYLDAMLRHLGAAYCRTAWAIQRCRPSCACAAWPNSAGTSKTVAPAARKARAGC